MNRDAHSYSDLLSTDSPPTACFAVPASDDPSSRVMVCATPTGGSDLKIKVGQLSASPVPRKAYPLPSPFPQQSLPPSAGEREAVSNLPPIR